jgi:hypothetical protein
MWERTQIDRVADPVNSSPFLKNGSTWIPRGNDSTKGRTDQIFKMGEKTTGSPTLSIILLQEVPSLSSLPIEMKMPTVKEMMEHLFTSDLLKK